MGNIFPKDYVRREFEDLKSDLNQGKIPEVAAEYRGYLNEMQNLPLNIAVVGKAGAGKSSFINAFWGINDDDDDDEAVEVWKVEETKVPKAHPHPSFPNITIWELPEIRGRNSKAAEYFQKVQFERYDVFIMVVTDRFTENDAFLAKEIQRMRKKFYYVRSKIDISIEGERRKRNFNMEKTLETIRNYCEENLRESAELSERVFLVSNLHPHMHEFLLLREKMAAELPDYKKHILTLAVQVLSENNLMMKKSKMKLYIKYLALVSFVCGAIPVVGLSLPCDIGILMVALTCFWQVFALDQSSLRFLALQTGKGFEELKSGIQERPSVSTLNAQLVLSLLMKSALWVMPLSVKYQWMAFGGVSAFAFTYYFLNKFLGNEVEDAQLVLSLLMKFALWVMPSSVEYQWMAFGGVSAFAFKYYFLNKFFDNAVEDAQLVLSLLMKSALWVMPSSAKYLWMAFGGVSSFAFTYYFLNKFLDNAVEDARKVRAKFLK